LGQENPVLGTAMQNSGCTSPQALEFYPQKEILELHSQQALWNEIAKKTWLPSVSLQAI
jgi:hypothetical protein